jgi:hypothetical protein
MRLKPLFGNINGFLVFWFLVFSGPLWVNDGVDTTKKSIRAVVYVEETPFIYSHNTYQYRGIVRSLVALLSEALNFEVEYVTSPRKGLEAVIINGKADATWLFPNR